MRAVRCSALQLVALRVAVCASDVYMKHTSSNMFSSALQCVAAFSTVLQRGVVYCSVHI